jgi:hypothetical protein
MTLRRRVFVERPIGPSLNLESPMGDQNNEGKQNPGLTDEEQKRENERADYQKGQASNPERQEKQDPQFDPSHIQNDPNRERA